MYTEHENGTIKKLDGVDGVLHLSLVDDYDIIIITIIVNIIISTLIIIHKILKMMTQVKNPIHAVANVDDYSGSARLLAATTLRNVLGTLSLGDILSQRETIAREMKETLDEATESWGVQVERVEVSESVPTSCQSVFSR